MSYQLTVTEKKNYLHAIVTGQNTREDVMGYLEEVLRECVSRNYSRVLIEERLDGPRWQRWMGSTSPWKEPAMRAENFRPLRMSMNVKGDLMWFGEQVGPAARCCRNPHAGSMRYGRSARILRAGSGGI